MRRLYSRSMAFLVCLPSNSLKQFFPIHVSMRSFLRILHVEAF